MGITVIGISRNYRLYGPLIKGPMATECALLIEKCAISKGRALPEGAVDDVNRWKHT